MIEFKDVTATYKKNIGIFDISFKVEPGEIIFIMGPTGAGKSTVLKAIYKEVGIDSGKILVDNEDVSRMNSIKNVSILRRKIGMVFQDFKLLNDRSVFDNISLPLRIEGYNYHDIKKMVKESLLKIGLPGCEKSYPLELSGGEQQRVCIARALVKKPKVILADEPTGNLDPNISDEILDLLELCAKEGTAVLMSTHNFPLIKPRRKKFIELNQGRMIK
tara:strand:+ start:337 stop:990 length:654 start_codon:yes stop_codon:yes gene_type:complete